MMDKQAEIDFLDKLTHKRQLENKPDTAPKPAPTGNAPGDAWRGSAIRRPNKQTLDGAYQSWSKGKSREDMGHIIQASQPMINAALRSYTKNDTSPVMRGRAKKLVIDAVRKYDPAGKANLKTWISQNLQGMRRYSTNYSAVRVPEQMRYDYSKITQAKQSYFDENGIDPSIDELADETGLSKKRVVETLRRTRLQTTEGSIMQQEETMGEDANVYIPGVQKQDWQNIWAEYVYHGLDDTDKKVYNMYVGVNGHDRKNVSDIAKALRISPGAVSQRAKKIANKMAEGLEYEGKI